MKLFISYTIPSGSLLNLNLVPTVVKRSYVSSCGVGTLNGFSAPAKERVML